jgi:hypothetical protein
MSPTSGTKHHETRAVTSGTTSAERPLPQLAIDDAKPSPAAGGTPRLGAPKASSGWTWLPSPGEVVRPPAREPCSARPSRA